MVHLLIETDYSAINQQIALKTIKKFGFSVNAVWNGKEALDYLLENPSHAHPKPDIILMDVQMPILDGYRATHLLRHHSPYSSIAEIRTLPIVAMTASAIRGDKEKCKKAGMDDYLAKPVKGKTLENMLLKWAIEGKSQLRLKELVQHHTDHDSNCTENPPSPMDPTASPLISSNKAPASSTLASENNSSSRVITDTATLPGIESEGDRGMQRVEAEEKATALRDDKLIAASESSPYQHHQLHMASPPNGPIKRPAPPTAKLTEENVTRLDREHEGDSIPRRTFSPPTLPHDESGDSLTVNSRDSSYPGSTVGSLHSPRKTAARQRSEMGMSFAMRGKLARQESDRSQSTIRQLDFIGRREEEEQDGIGEEW